MLAISAGSCSVSRKAPSSPTPSTRRMAERLKAVAAASQFGLNAFNNRERAQHYQTLLQSEQDEAEKTKLMLMTAGELLLAGESEQAIQILQQLQDRTQSQPMSEEFQYNLLQMLALANLRLAEQQNCLEHHHAQSCLFPIQGGGIHQRPRGAQAAAAIYEDLLQSHPEDLTSHWLLNLAYMTLGQYPDHVPGEWVIPPETFAEAGGLPRFANVAPELGVAVVGLAGGCVVDDLDRDGWMDIVASSCGLQDQIRVFFHNGKDGFSEYTDRSGLDGIVGGLNLIHADYDNDGDDDIFVLRGGWMRHAGKHPNSLLRNTGSRSFEDVTEEAGLLSFHPSQTAAWADYNNDGWLDLYIGNESTPDDIHPCQLYFNNGNETFTYDARSELSKVTGCVKAVVWGDYNNDGRPDVYISRYGDRNLLFRNDGPDASGVHWNFTEVAESANADEPIHSFTTWFWDYNHDGWEDLLVFGYRYEENAIQQVVADYLGQPHDGALPRLYRNTGQGTFEDVTQEIGLNRMIICMGANFGDLDNDGWLDFYAGTGAPDFRCLVPNRMFRHVEGNRFQEVTATGGFGHLQKGHGIAFADFDNDGDQDVYAVMGGFYSGDVYPNALFSNPGTENQWIKLRLEGTKSNRSAIGARLRVVVETPAGRREIYRTVCTGGSFGSQPLEQHVGLGNTISVVSVDVTWPNNNRERFENLQPRKRYRLKEATCKALEIQ